MAGKPITTLRVAFIMTVATGAGSASGAAATEVAAHQGITQQGLGHVVAAVVTLWIIGKLQALIADGDD